MNGYNDGYKFIQIFIWVTTWVLLATSQDNLDLQYILRTIQNNTVGLPGEEQTLGISLQVNEPNISSKEFCMKSFRKANRFEMINSLQRQLIRKLHSHILGQVEKCSNLRHRVYRLLASYNKLRSELKALRPQKTTKVATT